MTKGRRSEWTPLAFPTCGDGTFGSFATCCDGSNPFPNKLGKDNYLSDLGVHTCAHDGFIPENTFYRLAMKANNHVDDEDKDRWQITTQFGSKGVVKHDTPSSEQEMVIISVTERPVQPGTVQQAPGSSELAGVSCH